MVINLSEQIFEGKRRVNWVDTALCKLTFENSWTINEKAHDKKRRTCVQKDNSNALYFTMPLDIVNNAEDFYFMIKYMYISNLYITFLDITLCFLFQSHLKKKHFVKETYFHDFGRE